MAGNCGSNDHTELLPVPKTPYLGVHGTGSSSDGTIRGGKPIGRGALYHILSNRIYRGEIVHHDTIYAGEHEAIIPEELWDETRRQFAINGVTRRLQSNASDPSLLAGIISDQEGRRMTPSHAAKGSRRYRYYVSVNDDGRSSDAKPSARITRPPAEHDEQAVTSGLMTLLQDEAALTILLAPRVLSAEEARVVTGSA